MRPPALSWQSYTLATLCAADLVSTVWLCHAHGAAEANPIMSYFLAQGVFVFAAAKLVMTALPLTILEWARRVRPSLGVVALNTSLLGYLTLYGAGLAHLNGGPTLDQALAHVEQDPRQAIVWAETQRRINAKRLAALPASNGVVLQAPQNAAKQLPRAASAGEASPAGPSVALD
jgi:hypothetical protein